MKYNIGTWYNFYEQLFLKLEINTHMKISARQFHKLRYGMSVGYTRAVHLPLSFYNYMNHLKSCECDIMLNHKDESEREYRRPLD